MPKILIHKLPGDWKEQARIEIQALDPPGTQRHRTDWMLARPDNLLVEESFGMLYRRIHDRAFRVGAVALQSCYEAACRSEKDPELLKKKNWGRLKVQPKRARELADFLEGPFLRAVLSPGEEHVWGESNELHQSGVRAGKDLPVGINELLGAYKERVLRRERAPRMTAGLTDPEIITLIRFVADALEKAYEEWTSPEESGDLLKPGPVRGGRGNRFDLQDASLIDRLGTLFKETMGNPLTSVILRLHKATFPKKLRLTEETVQKRLQRLTRRRGVQPGKKRALKARRGVSEIPLVRVVCSHRGCREDFRPAPGAGDGMLRCPACGILGKWPEDRHGFHPLPSSPGKVPPPPAKKKGRNSTRATQ